MIKYNLKCSNNHEFESWFSDSEEFDKLKKKIVRMYLLFIKKISKSIMAPMISAVKEKNNDIFLENKILKKKKTIYLN